MKEFDDIDALLEKYFEGNTSLGEEKYLRSYFSQVNVADEHKAYAPMFQYFTSQQKSENKEAIQPKVKRISRFRLWVGVAASIMLLVSVTQLFFFRKSENSISVVYIDGHRMADHQDIGEQVTISLHNVSNMDDDIAKDQVDILNLFTE